MLDHATIIQQTASSLKNLHDEVKEALQALNRMNVETTTWNPILHFLITRKLDPKTRMAYETQLENAKEVPQIDACWHSFKLSLVFWSRWVRKIVEKKALVRKIH